MDNRAVNEFGYRRDIDGLRAVAVIMVVWFHAFPNTLKGGFVGVDIFFVISGYLISGIIFAALDAKTFSLVHFYQRRARRILPALLVVIAVTLIAGWLIMTPDELSELGKHAASATLFVANITYWQQSGYFDSAAEFKPLLHLWSLGVEEQFYFLLPPILWLTYGRPRQLLILVLIGAASFACNIFYIFQQDSVSSFFLPQARVWEFLAGTALALQQRKSGADWLEKSRFRDAGSIIGLITVLASGYFCRDGNYPGFAALAPVTGTALIIAAGSQSWASRYVLSLKPAVGIGLISYSLYLWHWPVLAIPRIITMQPPTAAVSTLAVLLSIALAILSYRFIELPFRKRPANAAMTTLLAAQAVFVFALGLVALAKPGPTLPTWSLAADESRILRSVKAWDFPNMRWKPFKVEGVTFYARKSGLEREALFIGDSNVEQYAPRVDELISRDAQGHLSAVFASSPGGPPIPGVVRADNLASDRYVRTALRYAQQSKVDTVVIGALWHGFLGLNSESYVYSDKEPWRGKTLHSDNGRHALDALSAVLTTLRDAGKKMYLILPLPTGDAFDPQMLFRRTAFSVEITSKGGAARTVLMADIAPVWSALVRIANDAGAILVDPFASLCSHDTCPAIDVDGEALYRDKNHLSPYYVRTHATFIDPLLVAQNK